MNVVKMTHNTYSPSVSLMLHLHLIIRLASPSSDVCKLGVSVVDLISGPIEYGILPVARALGGGPLTPILRVSKWFGILWFSMWACAGMLPLSLLQANSYVPVGLHLASFSGNSFCSTLAALPKVPRWPLLLLPSVVTTCLSSHWIINSLMGGS